MEQAVHAQGAFRLRRLQSLRSTRKCAIVRRRRDRRVQVFYELVGIQNKPSGLLKQSFLFRVQLNRVVG